MDRGMQAEEENRWTFEIAWEAANKGESQSKLVRLYQFFSIN